MIDRKITISAIRKIEGRTLHVNKNESAPLSIWYQSILDNSLEKLPEGDLAKLIRQKKHLNFVLCEAMIRISNNPLAGELYDGCICQLKIQPRSHLKTSHPVKKIKAFPAMVLMEPVKKVWNQ
ncbi:hypothetical protein GK047_01530 [Paenibacillus sp. SYP-B3998]|uniref:Uncharacterized protein n=1 Tax=Paenibacillus sp. SYP-B3998 TaxID=2678564 RepID=A0A6G3ZRM1_9BACL|nr:contact-dependent growth inhibition system immunity protein [Paenibacillus sp. SYP-B3998]NEW04700.1 hypothetical protein [Paenibacillus sp. SYP-B3998]